MSNNINSFSENMRRTVTAQTNTMSLLQALQQAMTTNDTYVTYDYENLADGKKTTFQLASIPSLVNRLTALENNIQNLSNGKSTLAMQDGARRQIKLTNLPKTPDRISGVSDPTTFSIDANWFFEDLMFPGLTVAIDLTGKIDESADRVKVTRVILDSNVMEAQNIWLNNLSTNNYDYLSLKALLAYNNIPYYEDTQVINLPLISNSLYGTFQIIADPEIIDGNTWYTLDTLNYSTIDENGADQGVNNILSTNDLLAYNDSLFQVISVDQNNRKVRLKILSGSAFPGVYSTFVYYQDPFRSKIVNVRFGAHEYDIIYVKGVNEEFNLLSNDWSDPIKFASDALVKDDDNNMTLADFYMGNVIDWGAKWIAEAKENNLTAYHGHIPNAPTLNAGDLRVVQINTQVNASLDTADLKRTASEIEKTKSQINSLQSTIAAQQTELQSITSVDEYNAMQQQIQTNTTELDNLQKGYTTMVNTFKSAIADNQAVVENPKYHIRGFFPIPLYKYRDESTKFPEQIIGFDIAYRYICTDNTATQLNTFTYTDTDGASTVTGTFTDWIVEQSKLKQRVWNSMTNCYEWQSENVADGTEVNINQIDIAITKGEKVEIKVRSISEAGYPNNPLKSEWSESIIVPFPDNLSVSNAMADLVQEINDDATNIAIMNTLQQQGVNAHLSDSIANTNSLNGIYFKHESKNIAYEDKNATTNIINSMSVQDKIDQLSNAITSVQSILTSLTSKVENLEALQTTVDDLVKRVNNLE